MADNQTATEANAGNLSGKAYPVKGGSILIENPWGHSPTVTSPAPAGWFTEPAIGSVITPAIMALPTTKSVTFTGTKQSRLIDADSATRKNFPMARGLLDYFPDALAAVAAHSKKAGDKHHPGEEMHWERGKSQDHADCIIRHLVNRGGFDGDDRESTALAWRALALLQEELEAAYNLNLPKNARF